MSEALSVHGEGLLSQVLPQILLPNYKKDNSRRVRELQECQTLRNLFVGKEAEK